MTKSNANIKKKILINIFQYKDFNKHILEHLSFVTIAEHFWEPRVPNHPSTPLNMRQM